MQINGDHSHDGHAQAGEDHGEIGAGGSIAAVIIPEHLAAESSSQETGRRSGRVAGGFRGHGGRLLQLAGDLRRGDGGAAGGGHGGGCAGGRQPGPAAALRGGPRPRVGALQHPPAGPQPAREDALQLIRSRRTSVC